MRINAKSLRRSSIGYSGLLDRGPEGRFEAGGLLGEVTESVIEDIQQHRDATPGLLDELTGVVCASS